jgi:Sigma-70 region 2
MERAEATWEGKGVGEGVAFEHAFEDFFGLEQERLLRVLWLVTGSLQEAEDIVQDTFLRVWERWPDIGSMESPSGQHSLVVLNSDGTETQVAHAETITGGSFTPEGSKVVYGVTVGGKHWKSGIYVVDADGGTPQLLYAAARRRIAREAYPTGVFQLAVYSPTLSPDGSRIAYIEGMGTRAQPLGDERRWDRQAPDHRVGGGKRTRRDGQSPVVARWDAVGLRGVRPRRSRHPRRELRRVGPHRRRQGAGLESSESSVLVAGRLAHRLPALYPRGRVPERRDTVHDDAGRGRRPEPRT